MERDHRRVRADADVADVALSNFRIDRPGQPHRAGGPWRQHLQCEGTAAQVTPAGPVLFVLPALREGPYFVSAIVAPVVSLAFQRKHFPFELRVDVEKI